MDCELKQSLHDFMKLVQCGGIRSYYDNEAPEEYSYNDSYIIHNFFCLCEEVGAKLLKEDVEGAEKLIAGAKDFVF